MGAILLDRLHPYLDAPPEDIAVLWQPESPLFEFWKELSLNRRDLLPEYRRDWKARNWDPEAMRRILMAATMYYQTQTSASLTTATTAYTALDTLGAILTYTSAALTSGAGGILLGANMFDETDIIGQVALRFYKATVTLAADNAAYSVSDADSQLMVPGGFLPLGPTSDEGANRVAPLLTQMGYNCSATSLFVGMQTLAGHTFFGAATSIKVAIEAIQP